MSELWRLPAMELAREIRADQATSRKVLQAHIDRVEAVNGHLNAVVRRLNDLGGFRGVPC